MQRILVACVVAMALLVSVGGAAGHPGQHGPEVGHLVGTGEWGKIELLGQLTVSDAEPDLIADVAVDPDGDYAYLARWGGADCAGPETGGKKKGPDGGVYVIDIRDLANPVEVGFIATHQDTLVGEGMQVVRLTTRSFTGDVLLMNHEGCGKNFKGGVSLWDVTDPLKPKKLSTHFGDFTTDGVRNTPHVANQTHSAFMWDAGDRAYLVMVDDEEGQDVDIFDITNPKRPVQITDLDLNQYNVDQPELGLVDSFLHDIVVKNVDGTWIMLLSYWDGGWVLLNVDDPANPRFLSDTDYAAVDEQLLEQMGVALSPEGNGHQAEFTIDNRFVIGTDEDFDPFRFSVTTDDRNTFLAKAGPFTDEAEAAAVSGSTVFVGRGCDVDAAIPLASATGATIAVVERGLCTFQEKVENIKAAGYDTVIIMNREGQGACTGAFSPGLQSSVSDMTVLFVGRDAGFALFDTPFNLAACLDATEQQAPIAIGTRGDTITSVAAQFDGWGYIRLFSRSTDNVLTQVDTFAIPEAMNPAFATGFGALSVHEVAVDPLNPNLAYLSYYAGGLRAIEIQCTNPADTSTCRLVEVGGYLDPHGNNFWGVETFVRNGETIILASDMDSGLWIFRDP